MKGLTIFIAVAFIAGGCADPLEQRSTEDVTNQLQKGVRGEGRLIDNEAVNNPTAAPAASQGQPQPPPP